MHGRFCGDHATVSVSVALQLYECAAYKETDISALYFNEARAWDTR